MNTLTILALTPLVTIGNSVILSWLVTFLIVAVVISFVVWIVSKFAGPPSIPEPFRWIIWVIVAIVLIIFLFSALGIHLP